MPPENLSPQKNPPIPRMTLVLLVLFIITTLIGLFYVNVLEKSKQTPSENIKAVTEGTPNTAPVSSTTNSLGGQIYEKAQNPLNGKMETQAPVANPINDAYKNPFE